MSKEKLAQSFVDLLLGAGVTEKQLEILTQSHEREQFASRLKPFIDLFSREAEVRTKGQVRTS